MPLKDLLRTSNLTSGDLESLLAASAAFKKEPLRRRTLLQNQTVVLYFNKPSTRTRLSMETAVARLGGTPIMVGPSDLQLGRGETIEDTAQVISRYARAFVIRTFADDDVRRFARAASIPVVNALTDGHHPCQSLADLLTLQETHGDLRGVEVAWVGDGNNVLHSLMEALALAGAHLRVATPPSYAPDPDVVKAARSLGQATGATLDIGSDPVRAAQGAHAVYTDTWVSMGTPEAERLERLERLAPFQLNAELLAHARPDATAMHCLPDHRGEEITAEVVDGPRSVVFDQAENRLHTATALLCALVEGLLEGDA